MSFKMQEMTLPSSWYESDSESEDEALNSKTFQNEILRRCSLHTRQK